MPDSGIAIVDQALFGEIDNEMQMTSIGKMASQCWFDIPNHFPFVKLDAFVVMPNHIHGILEIAKPAPPVETQNFASLPAVVQNFEPESTGIQNFKQESSETQNFASLQFAKNKFGPQSQNLASVVRGYKTGVKKYATVNNIEFAWQPRFHDHIIRNDEEYYRICNYITENPSNWKKDKFF